jgi:hypothetical protein
MWPVATGRFTSARFKCTSCGLPLPPERIASVTGVPGGPFTRETATSSGTPASEWPLTPTITSFGWMWARFAGLSGSTLATRNPSFTPFTVSPTPEKWPELDKANCLYSLGSK